VWCTLRLTAQMTAVRNILIVAAIAALVVLIPGGGTGANVAIQAVSLAFLGTLAWVASIMYRQHRTAIYALGDGRRAIVYAAIAVAILTLTDTRRLWLTGAGSAVWLVLIAGAAYAIFAVVWSARKY
jgi:hypothetical protein